MSNCPKMLLMGSSGSTSIKEVFGDVELIPDESDIDYNVYGCHIFNGLLKFKIWEFPGNKYDFKEFLKNYQKKEKMLKNVKVLAFVRNYTDDVLYLQLVLQCLSRLSPTAKTYFLVNKNEQLQMEEFQKIREELDLLQFVEKVIKKIELIQTSLQDGSLIGAWGRVTQSMIKGMFDQKAIKDSLWRLGRSIGASEVYLIETSTFLLVANQIIVDYDFQDEHGDYTETGKIKESFRWFFSTNGIKKRFCYKSFGKKNHFVEPFVKGTYIVAVIEGEYSHGNVKEAIEKAQMTFPDVVDMIQKWNCLYLN